MTITRLEVPPNGCQSTPFRHPTVLGVSSAVRPFRVSPTCHGSKAIDPIISSTVGWNAVTSAFDPYWTSSWNAKPFPPNVIDSAPATFGSGRRSSGDNGNDESATYVGGGPPPSRFQILSVTASSAGTGFTGKLAGP